MLQIRLTMEECQQLWSFVQQMAREGVHELHFIVFQLFVDNALEFSAVGEDHSVLLQRSCRQGGNQSRGGGLQQIATEEILPVAETLAGVLADSEMFSTEGLNQLATLQRKYDESIELLDPSMHPAPERSIDWRQKLLQIAREGQTTTTQANGCQATSPSAAAKRKRKPKSSN